MNFQPKTINILKKEKDTENFKCSNSNIYRYLFFTEGSGVCIRNDNSTNFLKNDIFFINKNDDISLTFSQPTTWYQCSFTEDVKFDLKEIISKSDGKLTAPVRSKSTAIAKIHCNKEDAQLLIHLFELLLSLQCDALANIHLMHYQMLCILQIMERNISLSPNEVEKGIPEASIRPILKYIHKNLRTPEMLSLQSIASIFHLSSNSLGILFQKEIKTSVKQYIIKTRLQAIAKELENGKKSLSEIAFEFGFTDESHLYKTFKKHYGIAPSKFKKKSTIKKEERLISALHHPTFNYKNYSNSS